jgi:hypothetical protein
MYYHTVSPLLLEIMTSLMASHEFDEFRLVGGTGLSLQIGHRKSAAIDLFTDSEYDSIDFDAIDHYLGHNYPYFDPGDNKIIGMGKSYFIGNAREDCIKLDLFYTDNFIEDIVLFNNIRLASVGEITAMKIDLISRGGRKKDFWDLHEVMETITLQQMLALHKKRYPIIHDPALILEKLTDFRIADQDFDPICLRGKHWEIIKLDMIDMVKGI